MVFLLSFQPGPWVMHAPSLALHDGGKVGLQTAVQPLKHGLLLPIFPLCMQGGWSTWSCSSPTREALPCSPPAHPHRQRMEGTLIVCNGIRNLICSDQNENLINSNVKVGKKKDAVWLLVPPWSRREGEWWLEQQPGIVICKYCGKC